MSTSQGNTAELSGFSSIAQTLTKTNWVRGPVFDMALVMGGAYITLMVAALSFQWPQLLPVFFWIWVVAFEGSHFWATFSRTYFDKKFIAENKKVLFGSLVFFAFPVGALYLDSQSSVSYTTLYGFFIFVWSLYHNARQHFGFTSIYCSKAKITDELKGQVVRALYFAVVFAQAYFLLNFKLTGTFAMSSISNSDTSLMWLMTDLPKYLTLFALFYFAATSLKVFKAVGSAGLPVIMYIGTCLIFYSTMFYFLAPMDQFIQGPSGAQALILIAIMNSLFHNIQYHAIVWHYGRVRYSAQVKPTQFGLAYFINSKTKRYVLFSLALGSVFAIIVWFVGGSPDLTGRFTSAQAHSWAYALFFGIIGHHFFLDQKIWRPSKQADLRSYLKS